MRYQIALTSAITHPPRLTSRDIIPKPASTSTQRKVNAKRNLDPEQGETEDAVEMKDASPDTPRTQPSRSNLDGHFQGFGSAASGQRSKKLSIEKYRGARDGNAEGWMMLRKRQLEKAHAKATPLDKAWTIIEYLEHEARDYLTNKPEAERDTDEKVLALLARRNGIQQNPQATAISNPQPT